MSGAEPTPRHPLLTPLQYVVRSLGIEMRDDDVLLLAGAFVPLDPDADRARARPSRGLDACFDFAEALGANCELFRSRDAALGVRRVREFARLAQQRWRPTPILGILRVDDEPALVVLDGVDAHGCECRSGTRVERLAWADLESRWTDGSGLASPVPSLQIMAAPSRYDPAEALLDSLRHQFLALHDGVDGLIVVESWLARNPGPDDLERYRARSRRLGEGSDPWGGGGRRMLATLTRRHLVDAQALASVLDRVADEFDEFLAGDDAALARSIELERTALREFFSEAA